MKKGSIIEKGMYMLNCIAAFLLLLSYMLAFVPPKIFSIISVLSLSVPVLLFVNLVFCVYWLLKLKKQMLLSLVVLLLGYNTITTLFKFSTSTIASPTQLSVMSYNVRLFNLYNWIDKPNVPQLIGDLINEKSPDIIAFQEYQPKTDINLLSYPFQHKSLSGNRAQYGQAIFSKHTIISKGEIAFKNSSNKAIYVDILKNSDTLRVYNVHFESLHINTDINDLKTQDKAHLIEGIGARFKKQQLQAEKVLRHQKYSTYKTIIMGDFNNTSYSYIYKQFKNEGYQDAFELRGNGFGKTFNFKLFPLRIDFILADNSFQVISFESGRQKYSDHYPIIAELYW